MNNKKNKKIKKLKSKIFTKIKKYKIINKLI